MKIKLCVLASRFPYPLTKGDSLRLFNQIKVLSVHFEIHLMSITEEFPRQEHFAKAQKYCASIKVYVLNPGQRKVNVLLHLLSDIPMQVRYFYDRNIHDSIDRDITELQPDYVLAQLVRMVPYTVRLPKELSKGVDLMDSMVLNDLAGQYLRHPLKLFLRNRERALIKKYEGKALLSFENSFIISQRDKDMLPQERLLDCYVLNNGVDIEKYQKQANDNTSFAFDVAFCGNMGYRPNVRAFEYLRDKIVPQLGHVRFVVAGAKGEDLKRDVEAVNLELKGYQDDMADVYTSAKMMVIPIFTGSGQQNKVLEAMACGTPCITTTFVNKGIGAKEGRDLLIGDDPEALMEHIKSLISHSDVRARIGQAGRRFVAEHYNWVKNTEILVEKIKDSVNNGAV